MEIVFLGTSSGMPTRSRNVSAVAIRKTDSKSWYLVDCGEGTQHRLLQTKLTLNGLQAVFITHMHGDHCYGLPGLLASATLSGRTEPLTICGPAELRGLIQAVCDATQLRLSYPIHHVNVQALHESVSVNEFNVEVVELSHRVPSFAYGFGEKGRAGKLNVEKLNRDGIPAGPLWGQIQRGIDVVLADGRRCAANDYQVDTGSPRKIIISGDNDNPELLADAAATADALVHESTYTQAVANRLGPGPQHSSAEIVARFAERVALKNLVLTHFSARYQDNSSGDQSIADIETEARNFYSGRLFLARDLDCYRLRQDGELIKLS